MELENEVFGPLVVKYSENVIINGSTKGQYFGEWSAKTLKPHGRGIMLYDNGYLHFNYWVNGEYADGRFIKIHTRRGKFWVDKKYTILEEGRKSKHMKGVRYDEDGKQEKYVF